ncbi:MAG: class I SAM-dependent methyltransferase [Candidatus Thorarchaeota archaeon]|nr:class I SAM-dependent methyltransferase [Candidatus Thorarchaeota archaeon]
MRDYYGARLAASRLRRCYQIASPRVQQYLNAEIDHVLERLGESKDVLELGCGYGRVLARLKNSARRVVGIDTSLASLLDGRAAGEYGLAQMNAVSTGFIDRCFDVVVCIQNGISAFRVDPSHLIRESVRITRAGGLCLFSTYSEKFWQERLDWFKAQADEGLIGEIDWKRTHDGVIVCEDGFEAKTFSREDFFRLGSATGQEFKLVEVDDSSLFLEIEVQ